MALNHDLSEHKQEISFNITSKKHVGETRRKAFSIIYINIMSLNYSAEYKKDTQTKIYKKKKNRQLKLLWSTAELNK